MDQQENTMKLVVCQTTARVATVPLWWTQEMSPLPTAEMLSSPPSDSLFIADDLSMISLFPMIVGTFLVPYRPGYHKPGRYLALALPWGHAGRR
jgi:hypothetical protein